MEGSGNSYKLHQNKHHVSLFRKYPELEQKLPYIRLGTFPTLVHPLPHVGIENLWIKRDDQSSPIHGGNKIRKLEFIAYFDLIVKVAGKGLSPFIRLPAWSAVFSGYGYQLLARISKKPPITSASWVRVGSHYSWWDCTKAREELDLG